MKTLTTSLISDFTQFALKSACTLLLFPVYQSLGLLTR